MKSCSLSLQMTVPAGYCYSLHGDAAKMIMKASGSIRRCSTARCPSHADALKGIAVGGDVSARDKRYFEAFLHDDIVELPYQSIPF